MRSTRASEEPRYRVAEGAASHRAKTEFPGCKPVRIPRDEIGDYDGRYEYWDAGTEIAWQVQEPTSPYHELPSQRLARLSDRVAAVRGSPVETFGTSDLLVRDAQGERHRILQADQILYLHPGRSRPLGHAVGVGHDDLPDVILEVDLTTDVRRGKLAIYESWGFPEVWVEVPDERAPSTPKARPSALTVYLLVDGHYRVSQASAAFPSWTATGIHRAFNERECSQETVAALTRVGRILGERLGTGPDDDPLLGAQRRESREEGVRVGREEGVRVGREEGVRVGREEGVDVGRLEGARKVLEVLELLASRDIGMSVALTRAHDVIVAAPMPTLQRAAMLCADADDFVRRIESERST